MKILMISPNFFDYSKLLCDEIKKQGHDIVWYSDEIHISFLDRVKRRLTKKFLQIKYDEYIAQIAQETSNTHFDEVLVFFGGRYFSSKNFETLKRFNNKAKFIYYTWDSIINFPKIERFYRNFDKFYSFDPYDCKKYGFSFLPLFYSNEFLEKENVYDYCSIMTFGQDKAKSYHLIKNSLPRNIIGKEYLFLRHKSTYYFNKFIYPKAYHGLGRKNFEYLPLNKENTNDLMARSKVVIDCPLISQKGLTIRTFEALHLKKKIITVNSDIKNYDFYCSDNIYIVGNNRDKIPTSFFYGGFNDDFSIDGKYSIEKFVSTILYS